MKRCIKNQNTKIELEIVAVLNINTDYSVAASKKPTVEYRELADSLQLLKKQLEEYRNFVRSIVSIIKNFGFDVVDEYQSSKSYSYYVQFTPEPYKGFEDEMLELDVKFRISDHYQESSSVTEGNPSSKNAGVIFKSFVVEGVNHSDIASAMLDVKHICQDLKIGNYSKLL